MISHKTGKNILTKTFPLDLTWNKEKKKISPFSIFFLFLNFYMTKTFWYWYEMSSGPLHNLWCTLGTQQTIFGTNRSEHNFLFDIFPHKYYGGKKINLQLETYYSNFYFFICNKRQDKCLLGYWWHCRHNWFPMWQRNSSTIPTSSSSSSKSK